MSVNGRQSEKRVVIYDKSQGNIAKHLSWDGLLHYKCIIQFASEKKLKSTNTCRSYRQKVDCAISPCTFVLKDAEFAR